MGAEPHVLHLHSSAGVYGAEYVLLGLIPALARAGIRSTLLCMDDPRRPDAPLYTRARALGLPVERVHCRGRLDWKTIHALQERIKKELNPLLHVHGYKSAFYAWLTRRGGTMPIVATLHGPISISMRLRLYSQVEHWLLRRFDKVCVVSSRMQDNLKGAGFAAERLCLVENGIDTERFRPDVAPLSRAELGIPADAFVFGSAMRLSEEKNPLGLLDAFAIVAKQAPNAWLALAGDGPLRTDAMAHAQALGIMNRVRLLGARDDLEHYYPMLDCFVLPSHYEGLPLALLEAMAAERAVVCTDVGQVSTVLSGLDPRLVPAGDGSALASAMQAESAENGRSRPEFRRRVCERYSSDRMARAYADVYRDLWRSHGYAFA